LYTGISSGNKLAIGGTLTKLTRGLKPYFIKPAWKKRQMSFLKKGAKNPLQKRVREIVHLLGPHY
jgi:hypothetical protein